MSQPIYKRILLKLSGEALQGEDGLGIDPAILDRMAVEIKELVEMGVGSRCRSRWWQLIPWRKTSKSGDESRGGRSYGNACYGDEWFGNA